MEEDSKRYKAVKLMAFHILDVRNSFAELEETVKECAKAGQLTGRLGMTNDALRVTIFD